MPNKILITAIAIGYFYLSNKTKKLELKSSEKNKENNEVLKKLKNSKIKNEGLVMDTLTMKKTYEELKKKYNIVAQTQAFKRAEKAIFNELNKKS